MRASVVRKSAFLLGMQVCFTLLALGPCALTWLLRNGQRMKVTFSRLGVLTHRC